MEFRTYLRHFDYALLAAVAGLVAYGSLIIYSATHSDPNLPSPFYYVKIQLVAAALGTVLLGVAAFMDFRGLRNYRQHIYFGILGLILLVFVIGVEAKGSNRWIPLGFFNLQPSEMAKVGMIVVLAAYLSERPRGDLEAQTTLRTIGLAAVPAMLVFIQPDFGTALVLAAVTIAVLFVYGTRWLHFGVIGAAVGGSLAMVIQVLPTVGIQILKPYQIDRLLVFLHPDNDPGGTGYHLLQSKIAIGSGLMAGKGLFQGTQTQLNFLPEHHTDFVFSVLGEELGFIGIAVLLALYVLVIWRGLRIAIISESLFGSIIAGGIVSMLLFQVFVNIGMTIGIMPITGIPLPFVSYGGSSMVANLLAIGLLESIHVRSKLIGDRRYRRAQTTA
ncbi:MAG: rod shape-determining protein RodA [Actinobacteria bacterium]|nr:rod shape-determining protein RodA [Actinomycetota bacterium]